ncbi:dihydroneopterin aldolase [Maricaulaceae bacterium NA33B04]|nr:dihydroneopterin aldolase [Maricaulaceae bacterium NA33B04]
MKLDAVPAHGKPQPQFSGERMRVRVAGLRLDAEVGVYDHEYGRKQPVRVSLDAEVDDTAMRPEGTLAEAVNYASLAELVRQITGARHHELLEDLAQAILDAAFADPRITRMSIDIDKLTALEDADSVGVSLERWR